MFDVSMINFQIILAARMLIAALCGLAVGSGMYAIGLLCTVLYVSFNFLVRQIDKKFKTYQISYTVLVKNREAAARIIQPGQRSKVLGYSVNRDAECCRLEITVIFMKKEYIDEWENMLLCDSDVSAFERAI